MPLIADLILYLHFIWILFMILGFPLAWILQSKQLRFYHVLGLGFYLFLATTKWYCPLTYMEEWLRQATTPEFTYQGSFLARWIELMIYVENWQAPLWIVHIMAIIYLIMVISSWWWGREKFN